MNILKRKNGVGFIRKPIYSLLAMALVFVVSKSCDTGEAEPNIEEPILPPTLSTISPTEFIITNYKQNQIVKQVK